MAREMKDSGIEWIGEIPKEWKTVKMNNVCTVITDYVASGSFASLAENVQYHDEPDYAMLIRTMDISNKGYSGKPVYINKHAYDFLSNSNLFGGEIILPNIGASVGDVYIVPKLYERMSLAPNSIMIRTAECDKYIYYFFFCDAGRMSVIDIAQSTAQPKFNKTDFRQLRITLPPLSEQQKIAAHLDSECAKIDDVITKTKATIEEYKKLKQSVITEAVTKGIRPNRAMKDSGIEWIGEIPAEWGKNKVFRSFNIIGSGTTPKSTDDTKFEGTINWIQSGDINGGYISESKNHISNEVLEEYSALKVYNSPFIVIAMYGASIGNIAISNIDACVNQACCVLSDSNLDFKYVFYSIKSAQNYLIRKSVGGGQPNISQDTVKSLWIATPSLSEQQEIADYLDQKCSEIDNLIAKKEQIVTELESYKKSLIYEYVTGKKEVI